MNPMKKQSIHRQRGGTIVGFIVGMVVGLACALAVAMYITKVPMPFLSKGQSRSAEQDAAEAKKNKDWDPNAALYGKSPVKAAPSTMLGNTDPTVTPSATGIGSVPAKADSKAVVAKADSKASTSPDPLGDWVKAKSGLPEADPFTYFVQVGAYRTWEEAESQRAKLALSGIESKVSERQQSGRMVYRVRTGPFEKKEDGEKHKETLDNAGLETSLVRVQRAAP
jgi:cell division protein FtsN